MKKLIVFGVLGVAAVVAARRGCTSMSNLDWQRRIEALPDNAPPKWMFRNITAIRTNTERILSLLEAQQPEQTTPPATAAS